MATFDKDLDVRGLNCPLPILRAKKALAELGSGQVLRGLHLLHEEAVTDLWLDRPPDRSLHPRFPDDSLPEVHGPHGSRPALQTQGERASCKDHDKPTSE